jgi:hypothetical protein
MEVSGKDSESRTIPAILSTEQPVQVYDYRSGKMIDEVLLASGANLPDQLVLLDDHSRWSSSSVLGCVRNGRVDGDKIRGTVHFANNAGTHVDETWNKVDQGHLTDGSIGYRYFDEYIDIAPGQTASVDGRSFTAGKRTLRVVRSWYAKEYSTTPIGADSMAKFGRAEKIRPDQEGKQDSSSIDQTRSSESGHKGNSMNKKLRQLLEFFGLRKDADDNVAKQFIEELEPAKRSLADALAEDAPSQDGNRSEPAKEKPATTNEAPDLEAVRREAVNAVRAEQERVDYIRGFSGIVSDDVVTRAINEKWDSARASQEFLEEMKKRTDPVSGHVGIHDAVASRSATKQGLQAALLMRAGYDLDSDLFDCNEVSHAMRSQDANAGWINNARAAHRTGGRLDDTASRALEIGHQYRSASAVDLVRAMLVVDQVRHDAFDRNDIWRRSLTSSAVSEIFTTSFSVQLLAGFVGKPDTTMGWCREADLPNFQTTERKQMGKGAKLTRRERGQTADHGQIDAIGESYRIYEFAQQFFIDYQDFVDDRLGALDVTPQEMGEAAAEVRPDMVYFLLMSNPTMGRDSVAVFDSAHNNLETSSALSADTLDKMKVNMRTMTNNGRLISVSPSGIVVPEVNESLALEIVGSREKRDTTSSTKYGTSNWAYGRFNVVAEPRLDVGVTDPVTGTVQAAKPGSTYMVAEGGRYGIEVGYLAGTGRRPTMRSFIATEGRFGRGWDIQHMIGAKIIGYEGLQEARS